MFAKPKWTIEGMIGGSRELRTKETKAVWAYSVSVVAMGATFEVQTKEEGLFKQAAEGQHVICTGSFEQFNGRLTLKLEAIVPAAAAAPARPPVSGNGAAVPAGASR